MASVCQLQLLLSDAFFSLISELVVALCRFTNLLYVFLLINTDIYSQLKWFCQKKKPKGIKEKAKEELFGEI